jgi:hypothetical protein
MPRGANGWTKGAPDAHRTQIILSSIVAVRAAPRRDIGRQAVAHGLRRMHRHALECGCAATRAWLNVSHPLTRGHRSGQIYSCVVYTWVGSIAM